MPGRGDDGDRAIAAPEERRRSASLPSPPVEPSDQPAEDIAEELAKATAPRVPARQR